MAKQSTSFLVSFYIFIIKHVGPIAMMPDSQFSHFAGDTIRAPIAFEELHETELGRMDHDAERHPQRNQDRSASYTYVNKSVHGGHPMRAVTPSSTADQEVDVHDEE